MERKTADFFATNPTIRNIAYKVKEKLLDKKYFPRSAIYFMYDTDSASRKEFVWVIVSVNISYEEAYAILDSFDADWWIDQLPQTGGKLSISIKAKEY